MRNSEQINELATALSKAQGSLSGAKKDSSNPFFKSRYADLESVWDACRDVLAKNGLSVIQTVASEPKIPNEQRAILTYEEDGKKESWPEPDRVIVTTTLAHSSGQWISDSMALTPKDNGPQAMGSCITYGRRYGLAAIVGVYQTDDDGEAAQGRAKVSDARGDIAPVNPKLLEAAILDFRTALALDAPEEEVAEAVFHVHSRVNTNTDLYLAVGDVLNSKERASIKSCVALHKRLLQMAPVDGRGR